MKPLLIAVALFTSVACGRSPTEPAHLVDFSLFVGTNASQPLANVPVQLDFVPGGRSAEHLTGANGVATWTVEDGGHLHAIYVRGQLQATVDVTVSAGQFSISLPD